MATVPRNETRRNRSQTVHHPHQVDIDQVTESLDAKVLDLDGLVGSGREYGHIESAPLLPDTGDGYSCRIRVGHIQRIGEEPPLMLCSQIHQRTGRPR